MASTSKAKQENARFATFVPTLELSPHDEELLANQAQALVHEAIIEYQHYRGGAVDWTKWKEVRRADTLRVFRERQSITKNDIDATGAPLLPEVLAIGNVAGTVEDMMYGALATTPTAMLAVSRCANEGLCEAKVMATLITPTVQEPFRHLSAKWFSFSLGSGMFSLRDCTVVESTGIISLENRERLGYVLRHSVSFSGVPDLQPFGVLRANIASWAIYRESGSGMVQCFVKSFHDLGSGTWKSKGLKITCDRALAMCNYASSAETKRLARLLRSGSWEPVKAKRGRLSGDAECSICLSPVASTLLGSSAKPCAICHHAVCPHCRQKKVVCVTNEEMQSVTTQQLRVCSSCVREAHQPTSTHLQFDEIRRGDEELSSIAALVRKNQFSSSLTDSDTSESNF